MSKKIITLIISFCIVFSAFSVLSAQTVESINIEIKSDKDTVNTNDSFTLSYKITNKESGNTMRNANINFSFINKLKDVSYTGSSTGLSETELINNGYNIASLGPTQSLTILLTFKVSNTIEQGKRIVNTVNDTNEIASTISFSYSTDPMAPTFQKTTNFLLPTIAIAKPAIASIVYPNGISGYNLSNITTENIKNVETFYIQGLNKITYTENIDLSAPDALNILKNPSTIFDLNSYGTFEIKPNTVFNKKAVIEYSGLSFTEAPLVYFGDEKLDTAIQWDSTLKVARITIDKIGRYSLVPIVKGDFTQNFGRNFEFTGILTDPKGKVEFILDGNKIIPDFVALDTGKFTIKYTFATTGPTSILVNTYSSSGIVNKQTYQLNIIEQVTPTPTPVPVATNANSQQNYISIFVYVLLAIVGLGLVLIMSIAVYTFYKKKKSSNETSSASDSTLDEIAVDKSYEREDPVIVEVFKKKNIDIEDEGISENRHEVIRAKVEERLKNKK